MGKLAGATVACAALAFVVAFFAAGAGESTATHRQRHTAVVPFADPAARAVAASLTGRPAALELPPPPRPVRHHPKATTVRPVTVTPTPTTPAAAATPAPAPVYGPPPAKHKHSGGTGTGTTVVGP